MVSDSGPATQQLGRLTHRKNNLHYAQAATDESQQPGCCGGGADAAAATSGARRSVDAEDPPGDAAGHLNISDLPPWYNQITVRGVIVGAGLGLLFCIITMRLVLGPAGIVPSLNVPGGLLSFVVLKGATAAGARAGFTRGIFAPFGVQENTVVQTLVSACYSIAFTGGFGTYLTAMSYQAYINTGGIPRDKPGFNPAVIYEPDLHRVIPYLLLISVVGIFTLTSLRRLMILEWRLPFPSGMATGVMLNSFHSKAGEADAAKKVRALLWTAGGSFIFEAWKWIWQGTDYSCGFAVWPTFGLVAKKWTFFFDSNQSYIGSGMICPHVVNWSMLLGAIVSWGIMWPLISQREGDWYPAGLGSHDFKGLFGYKVFLTIAMTLGEGVYMLGRVVVTAGADLAARLKAARAARRAAYDAPPDGPSPSPGDAAIPALPLVDEDEFHHSERPSERLLEFKETEEERAVRSAVFEAGSIPAWISPVGYVIFAALGVGIIPVLYAPVKWYYVLVAFIIAPLLAVPNSYGCGLTDWDSCSLFGKLALFAFAGWAGENNAGVIAGLGICGVILSACSSAAVLMQDFRTGYLTLSSPRSMFCAQVIGALMGCFFAPLAFFMIWATGLVGIQDGPFSNPFADIYRSMAILGTQGFGTLPRYCPLLMGVLFVTAIGMCGLRDALPTRFGRFVPSPLAMALPFYLGANNAINFWIGSLIVHAWTWADKASAQELSAVVGSGLLVGSGVFAIPAAILTMAGAAPPLCMSFSSQPPKHTNA